MPFKPRSERPPSTSGAEGLGAKGRRAGLMPTTVRPEFRAVQFERHS